MEFLLGGSGGNLLLSAPIEKKEQVPFALPPKNENMRRVYAYLLSRRGVDQDVVSAFAHKGMIYESANIITQYSLASVRMVKQLMPTSAVPEASQHSKEMSPEADPNTVFIGRDLMKSYFCLKHP